MSRGVSSSYSSRGWVHLWKGVPNGLVSPSENISSRCVAPSVSWFLHKTGGLRIVTAVWGRVDSRQLGAAVGHRPPKGCVRGWRQRKMSLLCPHLGPISGQWVWFCHLLLVFHQRHKIILPLRYFYIPKHHRKCMVVEASPWGWMWAWPWAWPECLRGLRPQGPMVTSAQVQNGAGPRLWERGGGPNSLEEAGSESGGAKIPKAGTGQGRCAGEEPRTVCGVRGDVARCPKRAEDTCSGCWCGLLPHPSARLTPQL